MENSEEPKKYTCIKPTVINNKKITVGDEVDLIDSQARPLKNGGFITFDEDAAKCIRQLTQKEKESEKNIDNSQNGDEESNGVESTMNTEGEETNQREDSESFSSKNSIGFEKGD